MGAYGSKPITNTKVDEGSNEYITFAASSMQGWRVTQEVKDKLIYNQNNISFSLLSMTGTNFLLLFFILLRMHM